MEGIYHIIIIGLGMLGLFIGGVLIDLDHTGGILCKLRNVFRFDPECPTDKGILHKPMIMLGMAVFFITLGTGILVHYMMDYIIK